jgi:hypothetical protein
MADKTVTREWKINLNNVKAKEKKALNADIKVYNDTNDTEVMYKWFVRFIVSWPYDGDPSDPESYGELGLEELMEVEDRVTASFQRAQSATAK